MMRCKNCKEIFEPKHFNQKYCFNSECVSVWVEKSKKDKYNIEYYMIDIDKNKEFCDKCKIKSVPTFFIMNGKDLLSSQNGSDQDKLTEMIVETFNKFNSNKHIKNK